ncbi:MAG TPA: hypothetical protein VI873_02195 [Candidatus Peribacteraceae bacterium]|nr:hypothetical protein [Candidatus Peribacteraceae bacterium]
MPTHTVTDKGTSNEAGVLVSSDAIDTQLDGQLTGRALVGAVHALLPEIIAQRGIRLADFGYTGSDQEDFAGSIAMYLLQNDEDLVNGTVHLDRIKEAISTLLEEMARARDAVSTLMGIRQQEPETPDATPRGSPIAALMARLRVRLFDLPLVSGKPPVADHEAIREILGKPLQKQLR